MAASLYRKYRPQQFAELIGQEHVAKALQNALAEDRLAQAYLFSGTRGTGKTSSARILGQVLNCHRFVDGFPSDQSEIEPCGECESCIASRSGSSFDVIELDAASNNGVDDMRELIEKVSYTSAAGGTKVYIIDEVHELTGRASNALLKTLEEPPEHVVFILATTNPEKVLPTIRSRTQHFEFSSLDEDTLFSHAKEILSWEEKKLDDETLHYVVRKGAGSVRDMLSYLDQVLSLDVANIEELNEAHGSLAVSTILEMIVAASTGDVATVMSSLHELSTQGKEPRAIVENIINVARDCLVVSLNPSTTVLLSSHNDKDELKNIGDKCGTNFLRSLILQLAQAVADMRGAATLNPLLNVEVALLAAMNPLALTDLTDNDASATASKADFKSTRIKKPLKPDPLSPQMPPRKADISRDSFTQRPNEENEESSSKPATLGALKRDMGASSKRIEQDSKIEHVEESVIESLQQEANTSVKKPKLLIGNVIESWPKVIALLSPASQAVIRKATPSLLENGVLTFSTSPDDLEPVKRRFKKDAEIIRGFFESLHETSFKFQIIAVEADHKSADQEDESKLMDESEEYNPVDHVVSLFGGEVVPDN